MVYNINIERREAAMKIDWTKIINLATAVINLITALILFSKV